jgi:CRP-like cAMP-binding protein
VVSESPSDAVTSAERQIETSGREVDAPTGATFTFSRHDRLFATRRSLVRRLEELCRAVSMISDELFHPEVASDVVVRRGNLRVSRFLPDGREVTLAVLQAGNSFRVRAAGGRSASAGSDLYNLADIVLMALGETELWVVPAGALDQDPAR